MNQTYDRMIEYSKLQDLADSLGRENAKLKSELYNNQLYQALQKESIVDTIYRQRFEVLHAQVINNSVTSRNNNITIDRGGRDGVKHGMGVVADVGIVGIVENTSPSFSRVISILHGSSRISASLKSSRYFGTLVWKGFNPSRMALEAIPKHANIHSGDTVQTSGFSHIFPEGLAIGTIDTFWIDGGSNFYTVEVDLLNDLSKIDQVYVVENLIKAEQDSLEMGRLNE